MTRFHVTIQTKNGPIDFDAIAASSFALHDDALDRYGPCPISVVRL